MLKCLVNKKTVVIVSAALVLATNSALRAIVINTPPLMGDYSTANWAGVGRLVAPAGTAPNQRWSPFCTGTFIAPQMFLTAAHCVTNSASGGSNQVINSPNFRIQLDEILPAQQVMMATVHPHYDGGVNYDYDVAVLQLAAPVANVTTWDIYRGNNENGSTVPLVGFGHGGTGLNDGNNPAGFIGDAHWYSRWPVGVKREAPNVIDNTTNQPAAGVRPWRLEYDFDQVGGVNGPLGGGAIAGEGTIANGDSGGPTFFFDASAGRNVVAGVHSTGPEPEFFANGGIYRDTRMGGVAGLGLPGAQGEPIWRWVDQTAGIPEPATAALLLGGLAMIAKRKKLTARAG